MSIELYTRALGGPTGGPSWTPELFDISATTTTRRTEAPDPRNRAVNLTLNGQTLVAHLVYEQAYDAEKQRWVTQKIIVERVERYSRTPLTNAQSRKKPDHPQFGYLASSEGKELVIADSRDQPIVDPEKARQCVQDMLQNGTLSTAQEPVRPSPPGGNTPKTHRIVPSEVRGAGPDGRSLPLYTVNNSPDLPAVQHPSDYLPRMQYALARAAEWAGPEMADQLRALASPEGAAMLMAVAALQFTPAGPAVNTALITLGGIDFAKGVVSLVNGVMNGTSVGDLNDAGRAFARGLSGAIIDAALGGLMHLTGSKIPALKVAYDNTTAFKRVLDRVATPTNLKDAENLLLFVKQYDGLSVELKIAVREGLYELPALLENAFRQGRIDRKKLDELLNEVRRAGETIERIDFGARDTHRPTPQQPSDRGALPPGRDQSAARPPLSSLDFTRPPAIAPDNLTSLTLGNTTYQAELGPHGWYVVNKNQNLAYPVPQAKSPEEAVKALQWAWLNGRLPGPPPTETGLTVDGKQFWVVGNNGTYALRDPNGRLILGLLGYDDASEAGKAAIDAYLRGYLPGYQPPSNRLTIGGQTIELRGGNGDFGIVLPGGSYFGRLRNLNLKDAARQIEALYLEGRIPGMRPQERLVELEPGQNCRIVGTGGSGPYGIIKDGKLLAFLNVPHPTQGTRHPHSMEEAAKVVENAFQNGKLAEFGMTPKQPSPAVPSPLEKTRNYEDLFSLWTSLSEKHGQNWQTSAGFEALIRNLIRLGPPEGRVFADSPSDAFANREPNAIAALAAAVNNPGLTAEKLSKLGAPVLEKLKLLLHRASLEGYTKGIESRQAQPGTEGIIDETQKDLPDAVLKTSAAEWLARTESAGNRGAILDNSGNKIDPTSPLLKVRPPLLEPTYSIPTGIYPGKHIFVIPDIHGNRDLLDAVAHYIAEKIKALGIDTSEVVVVQLGDLINKGHDAAGTVQLMQELARSSDDFGRLVNLRGNHEDPLNYGIHMTMHEDIEKYAEKTAEMFGKGLDNTVRSYYRYMTEDEKNWMEQALRAYPVLVKGEGDDAPKHQWKGVDAKQKPSAPSELEATEFYETFREIWMRVLERSGHLPFFQNLKAAHLEGPNILFTHGGAPSTPEGLGELLKHLNDPRPPLSNQVLKEILWRRVSTEKDPLEKLAQWEIADKPNIFFHGHTMGMAFQQLDEYSLFCLDFGFGLNSLVLGYMDPKGLVSATSFQRSPRGVVESRPLNLQHVPGPGNNELPNRYPKP